ncbi:TetR family transcriptional regulator [Oleiphilus sp. HI0071]|nr:MULTISPECIES: TetR family transcriptional regulator C-terminal domain-containing protein [unclassified Oleiphilus]KZY72526.1 TetR family transcriptional regulator [Oleiphilus sp. HI0065]KZY81309.1 TetR family transcriptional regulator [Oleiphilus sp. HI0071]KZZ04794.1 TetR family transcriptional regulator [Oleiphilus sp. HI0073]KZZ44892.1 TetR family transcriptional regulator [Oleiphilus sp. HI0118]KZZ49201.1 TetR family transcriptional regulator [Oleiphilus sp. HI0122]KZZ81048.1 TetR fami
MSDKDSAQKTGKIREQNRKNILAAAEDSFVKNGFKGTSMQSIADAAELPKANVLYYFKSKQALYLAVLDEIIRRWDESIDDMSEGDDPAEVLGNYIRAKVDLAIQYPNASKIFALEIIQGAPNLQDHLRSNLRAWVRDKSKIIQSWIDQGKMNAVDPEHLIFMIWSTTQHYADFDTQILTVTNKLEYDELDVQRIKDLLCTIILGGCGLSA